MSAPMKTSLAIIHHFLDEKRAWIERHQQRLLQVHQEVPQRLLHGEYIYFQGERYKIYLHETNAKISGIELNEKQIHFSVKSQADEAHKALLLTKWYYAQMLPVSTRLFAKWQATMKVDVNRISIRKMKSRWGSAHPIRKNITLNLRLIEKPLICLEYVIVHELVHFFEPSHNQRFYALMSHYLPEWKQIKKQLG